MGGEHMLETKHLQTIEAKIVVIRGQQVMLDRDLAGLYGVETRTLNQAVKRNIKRFPDDFMFQLTETEWESLRSQFVISNKGRGGRTYLPYVFTEAGCFAVSSVLNSEIANTMSVFIHRAFVAMKRQILANPSYELLNERLKRLEAETKLFNAKSDAIKSEHKIDLNVQNMEINDLSEKMTELLKEFNKFRDASIIIQKDPGIGQG